MSRQWVLQTKSEEFDLTIARSKGHFKVTFDDVAHEVMLRTLPDGRNLLLVDGEVHLVDVTANGYVASGGERFVATLVDGLRHRLQAAAGVGSDVSGGKVEAPIAGRIVKLRVTVGDEVAVGDGLVVLEAMKMENELLSEVAGKVTQVHVSEGDSVETSTVLITIE